MLNRFSILVGALPLAACVDIPSALDTHTSPPRFLVACEYRDQWGNCPAVQAGPNPPQFGAYDQGALYEAPGDPNPGAPGVWLGELVAPSRCFGTEDPYLVDTDKDWLADHCEGELARAFAPRMHFSWDSCPEGEPYWAAKMFVSGRVRLAYMPAYYDDCGSFGHVGDSEFIVVEVQFNPGTRHWEFVSMFLSAHYGSPNDQSEWPTAINVEFKARSLAFPTVWVAQDKHANYKSVMNCNSGEDHLSDHCTSVSYFPVRFPVFANRNAGSRHTDLLGCVRSVVNTVAHPGLECFYARDPAEPWYGNHSFDGWHGENGGGGTGYYTWLMSDRFEVRFGVGDWGPGPAPPAPLSVRIGGQTKVEPDLGKWTAVVSGGLAPFTHSWRVGTTIVGTGPSVTLDASIYAPGFLLYLETRDGGNRTATASLTITVGGTTSTCGTQRVCE